MNMSNPQGGETTVLSFLLAKETFPKDNILVYVD